jgi:hypothetical protein
MYGRYKKSRLDGKCRYEFLEKVSLFGCNEGFIPWLLAGQMPASQDEPYAWHLEVESALANAGHQGSTLIIDLKPKQSDKNLSLYEVVDVWGYSADGWTPVLLHLSGLFVDEDPTKVNRNDFTIDNDARKGPIYEFLYLDGTISEGKLIGRWSPPPVSPTNAVLLWPDALKYFVACIQQRTPNVLA